MNTKVIWQSIIVRRDRDAENFLCAAVAGSEIGRKLLKGIAHWLSMKRKLTTEKAPLCLSCDFAFRRNSESPYTFFAAYSEDPSVDCVVMTGVCEKCAKMNDAELLKRGAEGFCRLMGDDAKVVGTPDVQLVSEGMH